MKANSNTAVRGRRWLRNTLIIILLLTTVTLASVVLVRRTYHENLQPVSANQKSQVVTIPSGTTVREIADKLKSRSLIRSDWAFEWYVNSRNVRDQLQAGTYALSPSQTVQEIVAVMTHGKVSTNLVTILPGKRIDQIRDSLINDGFSPSAVEKALNPNVYAGHPALVDKPSSANLEGYIYPESFQKTAQTDPEEIIRASLDQMQRFLTPQVRAGLVRHGLTVHQGVILASIIEQEVGNVDNQKDLADKKKVAQVFLRRLKENKPLESDATSGYGAILDGEEPSLTYPSAYNTYQNKGLPPGPISNVGRNSLQAVTDPARTDYLFFVSGDDGQTYFSKTLEEHEAFTERYCTKLCNN